DEDRSLIFRWEHLARVEAHPERCGVRAQERGGLDEVVAGLAPSELGIGEIALMAVRVAEVLLARLREAVQLVLGKVLREPVALIVGEPELARLRMEVETDGVAHAAGDDLHTAAVEVHAADVRVLVRVGITDIAGRADRHVELAVGSDLDELPAVRDL